MNGLLTTMNLRAVPVPAVINRELLLSHLRDKGHFRKLLSLKIHVPMYKHLILGPKAPI